MRKNICPSSSARAPPFSQSDEPSSTAPPTFHIPRSEGLTCPVSLPGIAHQNSPAGTGLWCPLRCPSLLPQILPILQWMGDGRCVWAFRRSLPPPPWEATREENYVLRAQLGHLRTGNHPHSSSGSSVNPDTTGSMPSPFSSPQERGRYTDPGPGSSTHHPIPNFSGSPAARPLLRPRCCEGVCPGWEEEPPRWGNIGPKKGNVSGPHQSARPPASAPTGLSAQRPPPRAQQVRNPYWKDWGTRGTYPSGRGGCSSAAVSWRHRWCWSQHRR